MTVVFALTVVGIAMLATTLIRGTLLWGVAGWFGVRDVRFRAMLAVAAGGALASGTVLLAQLFLRDRTTRGLFDSEIVSIFVLSAMVGSIFVLGLVWVVGTVRPGRGFLWVAAVEVVYLVSFCGLIALLSMTVVGTHTVGVQGMAPLLQGSNRSFYCENCSKTFFYALSERQSGEGDVPVLPRCPNCGTPKKPDALASASVHSGDRVAFDRLSRPKRWDLVVYRTPGEGSLRRTGRVVGLPGEKVEIFDGDLFIDGRRLQKLPNEAYDCWLSLYDNQFWPQDFKKAKYGWRPVKNGSPESIDSEKSVDSEKSAESKKGTGWFRTELGWLCDSPKVPCTLRYQGPLSSHPVYNRLLGIKNRHEDLQDEFPALHDLRVVVWTKIIRQQAILTFRYRFRGRTITVSIGPGGKVLLRVIDPEGNKLEERSKIRFLGEHKRLEFTVADGQVTLQDGWRLVAHLDFAPKEIEAARQEVQDHAIGLPETPPELELEVQKGLYLLSRIQVRTDLYYYRPEELARFDRLAENFSREGSEQTERSGYWLLNDNSSLPEVDSRYFGPVDVSEIEGVARWRYWPFWRRQGLGE